MAYQKQGFTDGETLFAEQLERIEQGIIDHEKNVENPHNVTAQQVGAATPQDANNAKTEAVTAAQTYTDQQVKKAAPRNLMDNSDFRHPVNQRGYERWTPEAKPETGADANTCYGFTGGYTIDRWLAYESRLTINVSDGYLELVNATSETVHFVQVLENKVSVGKSITIAVKFKNGGTYSNKGTVAASGSTAIMYLDGCTIYYSGGSGWMTISVSAGESVKLEWIALYEGEYTDETLPEYQPKGYGVELAECQRYYIKLGAETICPGYISSDGKQVWFQILLPATMRATPTVTLAGAIGLRRIEGGYNLSAYELVGCIRLDNGVVIAIDQTKVELAAGTPCSVYIIDRIELSSDIL